MADTKRCSFCAEEIRAEATRCPYCRSRLIGFQIDGWHRAHDDARLAGVASAVAHALALPVGAVRLAFVLLTLVHLVGAVAYGALWLIVPPRLGEPSVLQDALARAAEWARRLAGDGSSPPPSDSSGGSASSSGVSGLPGSVISGGDGER